MSDGMTKVQQREREQLRQDWQELLQDKRFGRVLWSILERCRIYDATFVGDAHDTYRQGQRKIGLQIIQDMTAASSTAYASMLMQAAQAQADREIEQKQVSDDGPVDD